MKKYYIATEEVFTTEQEAIKELELIQNELKSITLTVQEIEILN